MVAERWIWQSRPLSFKWKDWIAPGGRIIVHLECLPVAASHCIQWQHSAATSVMLISPNTATECGPNLSDQGTGARSRWERQGYILLMVVAVGSPRHNQTTGYLNFYGYRFIFKLG